MDSLPPCPPLLDILVDRINIGIFGVNRNMEITLWNRFMESHSGKSAAEVMGKNLFECFDELPHSILHHKINSVFILKFLDFIGWVMVTYLFLFRNKRSVSGGV